uniref:Uncharacterized protein n=1 Tax=Onchocerca volvulus TaxID=6282 RepID=A0A8R1Y1V3_ONCVO
MFFIDVVCTTFEVNRKMMDTKLFYFIVFGDVLRLLSYFELNRIFLHIQDGLVITAQGFSRKQWSWPTKLETQILPVIEKTS